MQTSTAATTVIPERQNRTNAAARSKSCPHGRAVVVLAPDTARMTNLVHLIYVADDAKELPLGERGSWPTLRLALLFLLGLIKPAEMTAGASG